MSPIDDAFAEVIAEKSRAVGDQVPLRRGIVHDFTGNEPAFTPCAAARSRRSDGTRSVPFMAGRSSCAAVPGPYPPLGIQHVDGFLVRVECDPPDGGQGMRGSGGRSTRRM